MRKRLIPLLFALALIIALGTVSALADGVTVYVEPGESLEEALTAEAASVTELKVVTLPGAELDKDDFQFLSGVVVSATDDGRYSSAYTPDAVDCLNNLKVLDLSGAECEGGAIPPRAFQRNTKIEKIILPENLVRIYIHAFSMMGNLKYLGTEEDNLIFPDTLKIMGEGMVYQCHSLSGTLTLPEGLEAMGSSCFYDSRISGKVVIPASVNVNANPDAAGGTYKENASVFSKTSITSLEFEYGIKKIPDSFAAGCTQLTEVIIPASVTEIGSSAFSGTALTEFPSMDGVRTIGSRAFEKINTFTGDIVIPSGAEVAERAFQEIETGGSVVLSPMVTAGKYVFQKAEIGGNVTVSSSIPEHAFSNAKIGGDILLGEGVRDIGGYAFYGAEIGEDAGLTLPGTVETIGMYAFYNCGFTGSLTLPAGLTEIGSYAFYNHGFRGSLTIPGGVETIGEQAFMQADASVTASGFDRTLTIEDGVETISKSAFAGNNFTGSLTLPDSVTSIGDAAFQYCPFGGTLTLSDNLESIGASAFRRTQFTGNVIIPESVERIGTAAFSAVGLDAGTLKSVVIENPDIDFELYAFQNHKEGFVIYLSAETEEINSNYQVANAVVVITDGGVFFDDDLSEPVKDGCRFEGWYDTAETGGNKVTDFVKSNTYYARYGKESAAKIGNKAFMGTASYGAEVSAGIECELGSLTISSVESDFFNAAVEGDKLVITPKSTLAPGVYDETVLITTSDSNIHIVDVELTVTMAQLGMHFAYSEVRKDEGDRPFVNPLYEVPSGVAVEFSSSNPRVATVDENGTVTIVGHGAATIYAKASGNGNYVDKTVSYRLIVSEVYIPLPETHTISVTQPVGGSVDTNFSNASAGSVITVTATPEEGYTLLYVTVDGEKIDGLTFKMPDHAVTVSAVFTRGLPFVDVADGEWFYDYIAYVYANGLMEGVSATEFNPDGTMTRAMFWAVLARIDGETVTGAGWMDEARAWAVTSGVSDGTNATAEITRQEMVTMLYRFAGSPAVTGSLSGYTDAGSVASWATDAMTWAVTNGVITGASETTLAPGANATRAQAAAILMRFAEA